MQDKISQAVLNVSKNSVQKKHKKFAKRLKSTVTPSQINSLASRPYLSEEDVRVLRMALGRLNKTNPSEALRLTKRYYDRIA
ncbi:hypothetical protein VPH526E571_0040 [Vibrio phage 526E57-1]